MIRYRPRAAAIPRRRGGTFRGCLPLEEGHCHLPRVLRLHRLDLTDFRNYASLSWRPEAPVTVLVGPNGSGKTNLLEAISLLVPGRGLRGARGADLSRQGGPGAWAVFGRFSTILGAAVTMTGSNSGTAGVTDATVIGGAAIDLVDS